MERFRKAYPNELSVSSTQRIIIGRAFAMEPDLLLMDEPYAQMDLKLRFYLEDEVLRLWREIGTTVVFITRPQLRRRLPTTCRIPGILQAKNSFP